MNAEVVYHYNPTSNRNFFKVRQRFRLVVYHYNPTSNRNLSDLRQIVDKLYIIIILHQTATYLPYLWVHLGCISL